ncbi:MAG: TonB-dependent siderophore receptor [Rhodobacteraceae bacterium]|nr:TonB-dependent siderophore receptor [Paracoccaceae bacterium]
MRQSLVLSSLLSTTVLFSSTAAFSQSAPETLLDPITVHYLGGLPLPSEASDLPPTAAGGQLAEGARLGILGNRSTLDTPFSINAYTAELAKDQQARSVADVVRNDPSVQQTFPSTSYRDVYTIRGFNYFTYNTAFSGLLGIAPKQRIVPETVERVELLKGPNTFLYGVAPGGAAGGLINVVPKRAEVEPVTQVTLGYGSDANFGTHLDFGRRMGPDQEFGVRFNGVLRGGDLAVDSSEELLGSAILGLDYEGERFRIEADLGYQRQKVNAPDWVFTFAPGEAVPQAPHGDAGLSQPWAYFETEDAFALSRAEYDLDDDWTAFAALGISHTATEGLFAAPTKLRANGDFTASPRTFPSGGRQISGELGVRGAFDTGPIAHSVSVVGSLLDQKLKAGFSSLTGSISSNIYDPVEMPYPDTTNAVFLDDVRTTADNRFTALSFADTLSAFDERVQFILGGRLQRVKVRSFNGTTGALRSVYDEQAFTPAIGVVLKPWDTVSLYGNYVETLAQGPTAPTGTVNAGTMFEPTVTRQIEAGVKAEWNGLTTTLGVFEITMPNGLTNPTSNIFSVDGEQRNRGIEFNVYGEPVDGLRVLGGVAFIDGELARTAGGSLDGNKAVGVPDYQIVAGAEWDLPFLPELTVSGQVIHTASQLVDASNTQKIPDWTRLDMGARYTFEPEAGKPIALRLAVQNVFDTDYWASAASGRAGGISRGASRTVLISSTFNF